MTIMLLQNGYLLCSTKVYPLARLSLAVSAVWLTTVLAETNRAPSPLRRSR